MTLQGWIGGLLITSIIFWLADHICLHRYSVIDSHRDGIYVVTTYECMWCGKRKLGGNIDISKA